MIRMKLEKRVLTAWLIICCLMFQAPAAAWPGDPALDQIGGQAGRDPLLVQVLDNGNMGVFDWDETTPGSGTEGYVNRYYDDYCWSTVLFFTVGGQRHVLYGDAFQDCLFDADRSDPLLSGSQAVSADLTTITTIWQHPGLTGLSLNQHIEYQPESTIVTKTFTVALTSGDALTDLVLLHGGDVWFFAEGTFTQDLTDLTVRNLDFNSRRIVFRADEETPWDHWYGGNLLLAWSQVAEGSLSDAVEPLVSDAACVVGWQRETLAAGESWTVTTREDYSREQSAGPTPTVMPTPSMTPAMSPTPTVAPTAIVTPAVTPTPNLTVSVAPTPGPTAMPTVTDAAPTPDPTVSADPTGTADPATTGSVTPTAVPGEMPAQTGESPAGLMLVLLILFLTGGLVWLRQLISYRAKQDENAENR